MTEGQVLTDPSSRPFVGNTGISKHSTELQATTLARISGKSLQSYGEILIISHASPGYRLAFASSSTPLFAIGSYNICSISSFTFLQKIMKLTFPLPQQEPGLRNTLAIVPAVSGFAGLLKTVDAAATILPTSSSTGSSKTVDITAAILPTSCSICLLKTINIAPQLAILAIRSSVCSSKTINFTCQPTTYANGSSSLSACCSKAPTSHNFDHFINNQSNAFQEAVVKAVSRLTSYTNRCPSAPHSPDCLLCVYPTTIPH